MCGIVGYIGNQNTQEVLIDGLKKLEYRGYDSAGIAVFTDSGLQVAKAKGRLANLEAKLDGTPLVGMQVSDIHVGQRTVSLLMKTPIHIWMRAKSSL